MQHCILLEMANVLSLGPIKLMENTGFIQDILYNPLLTKINKLMLLR